MGNRRLAEVEDEFHFTVKCTSLYAVRDKLYDEISAIITVCTVTIITTSSPNIIYYFISSIVHIIYTFDNNSNNIIFTLSIHELKFTLISHTNK
jgi:hypothetical protein